ncbi:NUDIX hydrolase [Aliihoeflea sp. PC F10.4]
MNRISAASLAVIRDGRFLLVRRGRGMARGQYAFPGGRLEAGETPQNAARRELFEETGLTAGDLSLIRVIEIDGGDVSYELSVFLCLDASGDAVAGDDAEEAGWYAAEEMEALEITSSTLEMARELAASHCGPRAGRIDRPAITLREPR